MASDKTSFLYSTTNAYYALFPYLVASQMKLTCMLWKPDMHRPPLSKSSFFKYIYIFINLWKLDTLDKSLAVYMAVKSNGIYSIQK